MILRELFVKLGLDVDAQSFAKGQGVVEIVKAGLGKIAEFAHEAAEKISEVSERGLKIKEVAIQTNSTTDGLQRLAKAAASNGVDFDGFSGSLKFLARQMGAVKEGGEEQQKVFAKLGVRVTDSNGQLRKTDDVFRDVTAGFSKLKDKGEQAALTAKLFGRSAGPGLATLLSEGKEGLDEFNESAVMSPEQIAASEAVVKVQRKLTAQTSALWRDAISPLLPAISGLLNRYLEWRKANAAILSQNIKKYVGYVITGVNKLADAFEWLTKHTLLLKISLGILAGYFLITQSAAVGAALAAAGAWLLAALPILAVVAALALLAIGIEDLVTFMQGGDSLIGRFIDKAFGEGKSAEVVASIKNTWDGVVTAVKGVWEWLEKIAKSDGIEALKIAGKVIAAPFKAAAAVGGAVGDALGRFSNAAEVGATEQQGRSIIQSPEDFKKAQAQKYITSGNEQYVARGGIGPEYRPPAGSGSVQATQQLNQTVNAAPGMDTKELAAMAAQEAQKAWDNNWNANMEEANATTAPVPYSGQ